MIRNKASCVSIPGMRSLCHTTTSSSFAATRSHERDKHGRELLVTPSNLIAMASNLEASCSSLPVS